MARETAIIEFGPWLGTPAGRYLLAWEQAQLDEAVADIFGFHALQVGLPEVDTLRSNRMPHRWVAHDRLIGASAASQLSSVTKPAPEAGGAISLHCLPEALPFPQDSLDLVVLPHALELAQDPHLALAEVVRVLRPEGRVAITGLNPVSLWGLRQRVGHLRLAFGADPSALFLPQSGELLGYWRVRDWLRLLGLDLEIARLGCYRPALSSPTWLKRLAWMETLGQKSWPVFGAVYFLVATKRVRGMRLLGLARRSPTLGAGARIPVANRQTPKDETPALP